MKRLLILIWWKAFFVQYTQHNEIERYRNSLAENIFSCMELSQQSYIEITLMPVKRFYDYLKWKSSLEIEKEKMLEEGIKK